MTISLSKDPSVGYTSSSAFHFPIGSFREIQRAIFKKGASGLVPSSKMADFSNANVSWFKKFLQNRGVVVSQQRKDDLVEKTFGQRIFHSVRFLTFDRNSAKLATLRLAPKK